MNAAFHFVCKHAKPSDGSSDDEHHKNASKSSVCANGVSIVVAPVLLVGRDSRSTADLAAGDTTSCGFARGFAADPLPAVVERTDA